MDPFVFLLPHLYSVPFYLLWLVGIVYALINKERHPRTSLFAGIGFGILLLQDLFSAAIGAFIEYQSFSGGFSGSRMGPWLGIISFCSMPISLAGWILLLIAIFGRRNFASREAAKNDVEGNILL